MKMPQLRASPSRRSVSRLTRFYVIALFAFALLPKLTCGTQKVFAYELKKDWPPTIQKGSVVVLRVPRALWRRENLDRGDLKIELGFKKDHDVSAEYWIDANDLLSDSGWANAGPPYCGDFTVTRVFQFKTMYRHRELPFTEIQLERNGLYVELHFAYSSSDAAEIEAQFRKLIVGGTWGDFEVSKDFHDNVFAVQQARIFTGQLVALSEPAKYSLFNIACTGQYAFGVEHFKGKVYFALAPLEPDTKVYNSNLVSSPARVATTINERVLDNVKRFKVPAQEIAIDGLKFSEAINYRNFLDEQSSHTDDLQIYLPLNLCAKFADADITSQQLVDGSIVLLNGNRVQILLSESR